MSRERSISQGRVFVLLTVLNRADADDSPSNHDGLQVQCGAVMLRSHPCTSAQAACSSRISVYIGRCSQTAAEITGKQFISSAADAKI